MTQLKIKRHQKMIQVLQKDHEEDVPKDELKAEATEKVKGEPEDDSSVERKKDDPPEPPYDHVRTTEDTPYPTGNSPHVSARPRNAGSSRIWRTQEERTSMHNALRCRLGV